MRHLVMGYSKDTKGGMVVLLQGFAALPAVCLECASYHDQATAAGKIGLQTVWKLIDMSPLF
jgi:hypothetical protein